MSLTHAARTEGLFHSLKGVGRTVIEVLHTRLQLLVTEVVEEQARLVEQLLIAALALLCFFLGVIFVAFFLIVILWDTPYRNWITGLIPVLLFLTAGGLWWLFRHRGKDKPRLLAATLQELAKDHERLTPTSQEF